MSPFLTENEYRAYPFVFYSNDTSAGDLQQLPLASIVAARIYLGSDVSYSPDTDGFYLVGVLDLGSELSLTWQLRRGLVVSSLSFTVPINTPRHTSFYEQTDVVGTAFCGESNTLELQVTIGRLDDLVTLLSENGGLLSGALKVEPANVVSYRNIGVSSLSFYNADRTRYSDPHCPPVTHEFEVLDYYALQLCQRETVLLSEGKNISIELLEADNAVNFTPSIGSGDGEVCEQIPLTEGETPPSDRTSLDGGLRCNEVFQGVNGVLGRQIEFVGKQGVTVQYVPEEHRIIIDFNGQGLAANV